MQSPSHQDHNYKDNERKQKDESPTTTIEEIEEGKNEIIDSTTPLEAVKNKKRVHYPQINGRHPTIDSVETDSLQKKYNISSSGIERKPFQYKN